MLADIQHLNAQVDRLQIAACRAWSAPEPCPLRAEAAMTVLLPDVSEFQSGSSAPDWAGIKKMNGGAGIIRAGYGNSHLDHTFAANYTEMKRLRYPFIGIYQYLRGGQDVASQANAFCNWVGPPQAVWPGTVFICDLEEGGGDQAARALRWHGIIDGYYGLLKYGLDRRSWLYSYTSFAAEHNLGGIFASQRHTWIAAYSSTEPRIGHTLWQSTDGQAGSHITNWPGCGRCDTSVYNGTLDALAATGWQAPGTQPPAPKPPAAAAPRPPATQEDDMPSGLITSPKGTRECHSWRAGTVRQIVLFSDWKGAQDAAPVVNLRIGHLNTDPFDTGNQTVDGTWVYTITTNADCNGCALTRIDAGNATVSYHTNS